MKPHPVCKLTSLLVIFLCFALTPLRAQAASPDLFSGLKWCLISPFRGGRAVATAGVSDDPNIRTQETSPVLLGFLQTRTSQK
jgi:hypothetical protein